MQTVDLPPNSNQLGTKNFSSRIFIVSLSERKIPPPPCNLELLRLRQHTGKPRCTTTIWTRIFHCYARWLLSEPCLILQPFYATVVKQITAVLKWILWIQRIPYWLCLGRLQVWYLAICKLAMITWPWDALTIRNTCWLPTAQILIMRPWGCCDCRKCKDQL